MRRVGNTTYETVSPAFSAHAVANRHANKIVTYIFSLVDNKFPTLRGDSDVFSMIFSLTKWNLTIKTFFNLQNRADNGGGIGMRGDVVGVYRLSERAYGAAV